MMNLLWCELLHCFAEKKNSIDPLVIEQLFKHWCHTTCNMGMWVYGPRKTMAPSNPRCTDHANLEIK